MNTIPDKIVCSHLVLSISYYKEMEGDKLSQLPGLSQLIIHFCLEFKIEKNIKQFAYYVAFTSSPKTLWWEADWCTWIQQKIDNGSAAYHQNL